MIDQTHEKMLKQFQDAGVLSEEVEVQKELKEHHEKERAAAEEEKEELRRLRQECVSLNAQRLKLEQTCTTQAMTVRMLQESLERYQVENDKRKHRSWFG